MKKVLFLILCVAFIASCVRTKGLSDDELTTFIQHNGDSLMDATKLPGVFVGVFDGNTRFFDFGYAVPDKKIKFDSATIFEAGSITKTFTAYILESILQSKNIDDTRSIFLYLPDSVQTNKALSSISFLSLMNHTSGLPRLPGNMSLRGMSPYDEYTVSDLFSFLKNCIPEPDGKSYYSNLGMGLAGVLAERMAASDFKILLKTFALLPFDMKDATDVNAKKAQGYFKNDKQPFWNMNVLFPAGGLQCSASDMLNYLQAMSLLGSVRDYKGAAIRKLLEPTVSLNSTVSIGRGWHTLEQKGRPTIYWHNGGTYGFSTFAAFVKDTEQAIIVVTNQFNANELTDEFGMMIMSKMLAEQKKDFL